MSKNENQTQINGLLSPFLQRMRIKNAKPYFKGKRFLDIGCSVGELIKHLPKDIDYVGIEGNATYCKNAQESYPDKKFINLYLDKNNVKSLDVNGKFDTITMLAIIEHVNDPQEILAGLREYLADDGVIILTTPDRLGDKVLKIGSRFGIFMNEMDEHKDLFTTEMLYEAAKNAGYEVLHHHKFELGLNHLIVLQKST